MSPRYDYPVHPLALLFPELTAEEQKKLQTDIELHGQVEACTLSADGETLLDGRHRMKACKKLGREPRVERFDAKPGQSEADFIFAKNMLRRHLTDDQKAAIAVKWSDTEKAAAKERQKQHGGTAPGRKKNTLGESAQSVPRSRKAIANKHDISEHTVRQMEAVTKYQPGLIDKVQSGEIKLKAAYKAACEFKKWKEHEEHQRQTVATYAPKFISAIESGAMKLRDAYREAKKLSHQSVPVKPNGKAPEPEPTPEPESDEAMRDKTVIALDWLRRGVLPIFEVNNLAEAEAADVRELLTADEIQILERCEYWMRRILSVPKES